MLRHVRSIFILTCFCGVFSALALASDPAFDSPALRDAKTILNKLAKQHHESHSFALKFESHALGADGEPLPEMKGSLLVADSGCFRLEFSQGVVVSDGKILWQYFPANKQVIVKEASDAGPVGGILIRFLQARPMKAKQQNDGTLRVALDPASVGESLDSLILILDSEKSSVREVETLDPADGRTHYNVKSLRFGVAVKSRDFTFQAPRGVETVDMR